MRCGGAGCAEGQGRRQGAEEDDKPPAKPDDKPDDKKGEKKVVDGEWGVNYDAAIAEAKKTKKFIVANFDADWQENCASRRSSLHQARLPRLGQALRDPAEGRVPGTKPLPEELKKQNDALAAKYKVEKYPTTVFINAEGEAVGTLGYTVGGANP